MYSVARFIFRNIDFRTSLLRNICICEWVYLAELGRSGFGVLVELNEEFGVPVLSPFPKVVGKLRPLHALCPDLRPIWHFPARAAAELVRPVFTKALVRGALVGLCIDIDV